MFLTTSKSITSSRYFAQCLLPSIDELIVPNIGHPHSTAQPAMTSRSTTLGLCPPPSWVMEVQTICTSKKRKFHWREGPPGQILLFTYSKLESQEIAVFVSQTWSSNNNLIWFSPKHEEMHSQLSKVTNTTMHYEYENKRGLKRSVRCYYTLNTLCMEMLFKSICGWGLTLQCLLFLNTEQEGQIPCSSLEEMKAPHPGKQDWWENMWMKNTFLILCHHPKGWFKRVLHCGW